MPDVFTEPLENNYFKCCRKCVVILKKWSLTHFCLLSLLFAVNRTATVGRLELLGCLSVYRLDTEPSPDQLSAVAKSHHILTNWVHYLGGILHLPAKCGQCFGWCCKVFTWNDWTGSELLFIIFQEKKGWLVRNSWILDLHTAECESSLFFTLLLPCLARIPSYWHTIDM